MIIHTWRCQRVCWHMPPRGRSSPYLSFLREVAPTNSYPFPYFLKQNDMPQLFRHTPFISYIRCFAFLHFLPHSPYTGSPNAPPAHAAGPSQRPVPCYWFGSRACPSCCCFSLCALCCRARGTHGKTSNLYTRARIKTYILT